MNLTKTEEPMFPSTPEAGGKRWWQRRWAQWLIIFGVWTVLAFLFTNQLYYTRYLSERPITWRDAASSQFIYPYLWAFGTVFIFWLAERFPLDRQKLPRNLFVHFLWATLCVVALNGLFHIILHFLFVSPKRPYMALDTLQTIIYNSTEAYGIYALLLLLHQAFRYYRRFREGELRAAQLETQLSQAQLQALKMQLHPHFLFNTLHSISALVHKDPECADRMIARLGDFLRLTLENSGAQEVSLQKELEFLRCYLEIERVRFQDRLTTHMEIDSQALDTPVPNLILQPIVENALRHGIAPRSTPGRIEISAKRKNGSLRIEVQDNGPGISAISKPNGRFREGLGLANTRARLRQLYGADHSFELQNAPGGGLLVMLEIPATRASTS
ncbi:MAG TPA: histidine kinase [Pyrinomonadaceae bacterium]|nr:histidine kinase [Pyrinomonadaceae bacterium]